MKAIQFTMFGDPDVLKYVEAGELNCNDDQVLVRTQAVGINRIDCKIREGSRGPVAKARFYSSLF